jgi:Beta-galactosidase
VPALASSHPNTSLELVLKRLLSASLIVLVLLALSASGAWAKSPPGFFGVVLDPQLAADNPPAAIDQQLALMASSGVQSVRTDFDWETTEPRAGMYVWGPLDNIVTAAARSHLQLLPIVEFTPRWASSHRSRAWDEYAPATVATFATFVRALVDRYGPGGSFWAANPALTADPIRAWQIWNEPEGTKYDWRSRPWPATYTALLRAAYVAIHRADRGASVVSGALVGLNTTTLTPWAEARDLYAVGARRYFDVLALNAFTNAPSVSTSVKRSLEIVRLVRQVMRAHGDGRKPIWVTEVTWTAAKGRILPSQYGGFETTPQGQAARLTAYYAQVAAKRPFGIQRAFWYTWATTYEDRAVFGIPPTFQYAGLVQWTRTTGFARLPLLSAYQSVAARFEH